MKNKYLPIGTVCDIKVKNKKVMIIGYCVPEFNGDLKVRDYVGCAFPEGILLPNQMICFNHEDITNIHFLGFKNEEQERLDSLLNKNNGNDVERAKNFHEDNDMYLTSNNTYSKLLFDENGVVMLAETKPLQKYNFDENGYVTSIENAGSVENPFHKEYQNSANEVLNTDHSKWNIFSKIEFDENGTVIEAKTTNFENNALSKLEFDENGIVITDGDKKVEQTQKYNFDENGTLISKDSYTFDEDGVLVSTSNKKMEEVLSNKKTSNYKFNENGEVESEEAYEFDTNGNLVSIETSKKEEQVPPIGPGLPGYVEPKNSKTSNYKFDESGNIVSEEIYEFDSSGNLVSIDSTEMEEEVPPIGPGLPGYVEPKKETTYEFDSNGTVVEAN